MSPKDAARDLVAFTQASPSPFHCVEEGIRRLSAAGFAEVDEASEPHSLAAGAGYFLRRSGTLVAWRCGTENPARAGFRIIGAHTDSPNLRLKPRPSGSRRWRWRPAFPSCASPARMNPGRRARG